MIWLNILPHIPKSSRYTIGSRVENIFLDLLELSYTTYFNQKEEKAHNLSICISKLDVLKFLISIMWEGKLISHKQYEDIAKRLDEIGKMFWGWKKSLDSPEKKNRTF
ncbi:MAG: four helix bundle protein [Patescibacteria group bacterium]